MSFFFSNTLDNFSINVDQEHTPGRYPCVCNAPLQFFITMTELYTRRKRKQTSKHSFTEKKQKTLQAFFAAKEEPAPEPVPSSVECSKNINTSSSGIFSGIDNNLSTINFSEKQRRPKINLSDREENIDNVIENNNMTKSVPEKESILKFFGTSRSNIEDRNKAIHVLEGNKDNSKTRSNKNLPVVMELETRKPKLKPPGTLSYFFATSKIEPQEPFKHDEKSVESTSMESKLTDNELNSVIAETEKIPKPLLPLHPFFMKRTSEFNVFRLLFRGLLAYTNYDC